MQKQQPLNQPGPDVKKETGKRQTRIFARVLLYLVAVFCVVIVGSFLLLQTRPARDAITRIVEKAIAQNTRAECRIEELSGNLFSRFEIKGVKLKDSKTGVPLMSADRIDISYSIPMLLSRVLWINRLTVDGVSVNLLEEKDGTWNFEMLALENPPKTLPINSDGQPPESSGGNPYTVKIRRLLIRNSDVTLAQQTDAGETIRHFKKIECQAVLDIGKEVSAKISQLAIRLDNPRVDLRGLSGEIRYNFDERRLNFKDIRVKGRKSDFTVNGLLGFPDNSPDMVNMNLHADIKALSLGEIGQAFSISMPDEAFVSGKISVAGPVSKMDCRVDLRLDTCHVESQGKVFIDELNNVGLDIAGKIAGLDLSALPVLDLESFPGNMNTDFSLSWQQIGMPDQTGRIFLDLTSSRLWDYLIDEAKLDIRITGDDFIFKNILLKTPYGKLAGSGSLTGIMSAEKDNQIQFTADIKEFNPENLIKNSQFTGNINGTVRSSIFIPKTFAKKGMTADIVCRINPSRLKNIDISSVDINASLLDEKIILKRFDMESSLGTAAVTGTASIKDETCRLKAAATLPDIKLIKSFIPGMAEDETLAGSVSVTADIDGSWKGPDVTAVVNAEKVIFKDVSADFLTADGHWIGDFKEFNFSGKCKMKNVRINSLQIPVLNCKTTITPDVIHADFDLVGEQKEQLVLSGNVSNWMAPVKAVSIEKMKLVSFDQPPLVNREPIKLSISQDRILIDSMHLDSGNASLVLKGEVGLMPPEDVSATLVVRDFDINRISGFFKKGEKFQGLLSLNAQLSGFLDDPVIKVDASLKDGAFDTFSVSDATAMIKYADSKMRVAASAYRQNEKLLDVNGTALLDLSLHPFEFVPKPDGLDLTMDLDKVDISWISDIINDPEYDISGILDATASVSGDFFQPQVKGRMQLSDGALDLKKQKLIYETLNADIRFEKETITIDDLNIKGDKEGSLHLSGVMTHDNFKPQTFNIRVVGDQFYIPFHSGVDARINPDITLSGAWEAPVLTGEIKVVEGRVNLERFFEKKLSEIKIIAPESAKNGVLQIPEKEPEPLEFVDPLTADVAVIIPNDFWFKGKDEFIEIKGKVQLKKDPHKPFVVYGSVFPVRGTYRFRGRLFQVKQGELIFAGQEDINPSLNIEAVAAIDDVKIIIRLTGTFEQLNLVLDSEPLLDQSAIISYLVFGRAPDDLSAKESFQAEEAALSFTGQIAADKLRDLVGESLGIDYLNISAGSGALRHGSLTMGKYVLPRVFVTFRQGFDETVTQKVEVTYEINKNFDLETQIDSEQTSALDIIWKYEY